MSNATQEGEKREKYDNDNNDEKGYEEPEVYGDRC